jgi:hypothetical protein
LEENKRGLNMKVYLADMVNAGEIKKINLDEFNVDDGCSRWISVATHLFDCLKTVF